MSKIDEQPWPHDNPADVADAAKAGSEDLLWVGKSVPRRDGVDKVTGRAMFTSDIALPGMLHAAVLRSPHPHARIVSIDASEAWNIKGVRAVATHENTPQGYFNAAPPMFITGPAQERVLDQRIFDTVVRHVGDEVAAVAADTKEIAERAVRALKVEYEILPFVLDPFEAMQDSAPELHPGKGVTHDGRNIPGEIIRVNWGVSPESENGRAEIEAALAACDEVVEGSFTLPIVKQVQLETMSAVAQVEGSGKLTVWSTTQSPHICRYILAAVFDMPSSKVRVLAPPNVGGGFGVRIGFSGKAEPIAAALAFLAGKPVRLSYSRDEDFVASDTRHGGRVTVRLGASKDGKFQALDLGLVFATGAYSTLGVDVCAVAGCNNMAIYNIPKMLFKGHSVYTNHTPAGAYRGYGNPQGNFALEGVVDIMAERLGINPYALREKNIMKSGETWFLPFPCSSSELPACMEKGAASIKWDRLGTFDNSGTVKRGLGMAVGTHGSNAQPFMADYDNAFVTVQVDGSLHVFAGVPDIGPGASTSLPQIAAEKFGANLDDVILTYGDTESTPFTIGSHASRTLYSMGLAIELAMLDARERLLKYAGKVFNKKPEELDLKNSVLFFKGQEPKIVSIKDMEEGRGNACRLSELCYHAQIRSVQFIGVGRCIPPNSPPWHCCFADVSVDTETGQVQVHKLVAAHDVGVAINPMLVEGQIEGGAIQGLGYALTEEITYSQAGRQHNHSMHNYMVPTFNDIPELDSIIVEAHDPQGPYGAKGAGECSLVCPASALANAVSNALGVRVWEIPMTPERVLKLLNA